MLKYRCKKFEEKGGSLMKIKNPYKNAELEIFLLAAADVIRTSNQDYDVPSEENTDDNWITP